MEREIKKIVDRVLFEEINKAGLRIKNRIFENQGETCECGGMMYEGECMECGNMYEGDITELGGMDDGHPRFGNKNLSRMSRKDKEDLMGDRDYEESFDELDNILKGSSKEDDIDYGNTKYGLGDDDDEEYKDRSMYDPYYGDDDEEEYYPELRMPRDMPSYKTKYRHSVDEGENGPAYRGAKGYDDSSDSYTDGKESGFEEIGEEVCEECGDTYESELEEKLYGNQSRIDRNKNGRIDKEDFKMLRGRKYETKEGAKPDFLDLDDDGDKKEPMKSAAKQAKGKKVEETYYRIENFGTTLFTENEMVDMIEKIIKENTKYEKGKVSTSNVLKSSLNRSGKDENDYIKSVTKKMKEYLKDGSKGDYEMNPKHFPKGNGELEEMDKMAFSLTDDNEDFNYEIAGLNIPVPDAIEFNDERMNKYYEGSSETGNAPGGNALESDANSRFNKMRKKQTLDKLKKQSYNKAPQPVFNEKSGQEKGEGIKIKLESTEDKKVLSDISKMKNLIGYNQKTQ